MLTQFKRFKDKRKMNKGQEYDIKFVKTGKEATLSAL